MIWKGWTKRPKTRCVLNQCPLDVHCIYHWTAWVQPSSHKRNSLVWSGLISQNMFICWAEQESNVYSVCSISHTPVKLFRLCVFWFRLSSTHYYAVNTILLVHLSYFKRKNLILSTNSLKSKLRCTQVLKNHW